MYWVEGHRDYRGTDPSLATTPAPVTGGQYRHYRNNQKYVFIVFAATWQLLFCPLLGMLIVFS